MREINLFNALKPDNKEDEGLGRRRYSTSWVQQLLCLLFLLLFSLLCNRRPFDRRGKGMAERVFI